MSNSGPRPTHREGWNERYNRDDYLFGTEPNDFLAAHAGEIPAGSVLCLAEGEGRNGVYLAGRGYAVTGVDQSEIGLAKAERLAAERGVQLTTIRADLAQFAIEPGAWAGIISVFFHVPAALRADVYRRSVAGLQPGGVLIIEAYTPEQLRYSTGGPRDPNLLPTLAQLEAELAGLTIEIGIEQERDVVEGTGHTGLAHTVQVLARKPNRG